MNLYALPRAAAALVAAWLLTISTHAASVATTAYFPNISVKTNAAAATITVTNALNVTTGTIGLTNTTSDAEEYIHGLGAGSDGRLKLSGFDGSQLEFQRNGVDEWRLERKSGTDDLYLYNNTGAPFTLLSTFWRYTDGHVGINSTSPTGWLTVGGDVIITNATAGTSEITINGPASPTAAKIVFNSGGVLQGGLFVPSANTYSFRNSTAAQRVNVSGTYTDDSNYRRGYITDSTAGVFDIGSEGLGTGATGNTLRLLVNGTAALTLGSSGQASFVTSLTIGAGNAFSFSARSAILSPSDGVLEICNAAVTDFSRLQFGGTDATKPSIAKSGTTNLFAALADLSGPTTMGGSGFASSNVVAAVSIDVTGWTNVYGFNATVMLEGVGVTYVIKNTVGTPVYTNATTVANATIRLPLNGAVVVTAGASVSGRALPW